MIENGLFGQRVGVGKHEFMPAFDRFPVGESACAVNPTGFFRDVGCEPADDEEQAVGPSIFGRGFSFDVDSLGIR